MQYTQYSTTNMNNQMIFASKTVLPYLYAPVGVVGLSASARHKTAPHTRPRFRRVNPSVTVDVERSDDLGKALCGGLAAKTQHPVPGWAADTCTRRTGTGVSSPISANASPHLAVRLIIQFLFLQASGPTGPPLRDRNRTTHTIFDVRVQQLKLYLRMVSRLYSSIQ